MNYKGAAVVNGPSPIEMDRFGLWTGKFTKTVPTANAHINMPGVKSNHPVYIWLQLERARMVHRGPFTDIVSDYAGIPANNTDPVYQLFSTKSSEPIDSHQDFEDILSEAGLTLDDNATTGVLNADGTFRGFPASVKESENDDVKSLFGVESYLLRGATWRKTYMTRSRPTSVNKLQKVDNPDGNPPNFGGREWLYDGLSYTERGKTFAVTEEWKLGGINRINRLIYPS
jgi:hypothetical protein